MNASRSLCAEAAGIRQDDQNGRAASKLHAGIRPDYTPKSSGFHVNPSSLGGAM